MFKERNEKKEKPLYEELFDKASAGMDYTFKNFHDKEEKFKNKMPEKFYSYQEKQKVSSIPEKKF